MPKQNDVASAIISTNAGTAPEQIKTSHVTHCKSCGVTVLIPCDAEAERDAALAALREIKAFTKRRDFEPKLRHVYLIAERALPNED